MNNNKTVPILLTIIAVLFVSILVTLAVYLPKNQSTPVALTPTGTPVVTAVPTTTSTSVIPNDWKTYTNAQYNYSFNYPNTWFVADQNGTVYINDSPIPDFPLTHGLSTAIQVNVYSSQLNSSSDSSLKASHQKIIVDGVEGEKTIFHEETKMDGVYLTTFVFKKDKHLFHLVYFNSDANGTHNPIFDQIISTFKFTDQNQTIDTSNWKTYSDKEFNISFNYPSDWHIYASGGSGQHYISIENFISDDSNSRGGFDSGQFRFIINKYFRTDPTPPNKRSFPKIYTLSDLKNQVSQDFKLLSAYSRGGTEIKFENEYKINGYDVYYVESGYSMFVAGKPDQATYIIDGKGNAFIINNVNPLPESDNYYNQILFTFKFTQ